MERKQKSSFRRLIRIAGSNRAAVPGARFVRNANPNERIQVTVSIRPQSTKELQASVDEISTRLPGDRRYLTPAEVEAFHGASQADLQKIRTFALNHGLEVSEANAQRRTVVLRGTINSLSLAFGVNLGKYRYHGVTYRGRTGWIHIPEQLDSIIQGVHGLDNRPQFRPNSRRIMKIDKNLRIEQGGEGRYCTPVDVARMYNFPTISMDGTRLDGSGQCIGIIELGGGFKTDELDAYFRKLGIPTSKVSTVSVGNGKNNPGADRYMDGEVLLDIAVAGAVAPRSHIVVYFSDLSTDGFLNAVTTAINDRQHNPLVISISWGGPEDRSAGQLMDAMNQAFEDAAALGKTICCVSGDHGSSDERPNPPESGLIDDNLAHVDFPASSPYVLACGGTQLNRSDIEVVWNNKDGASGGGVSDYFARANYQQGVKIPKSANNGGFDGRGLPDVSGLASPGYEIRVQGKVEPRGGTSAVAPLWAGLITLINQSIGKPVGLLNPLLYGRLGPGGAFHDVTEGDNCVNNVKVRGKGIKNVKGYKAQKGWDACTGFGTPDGTKLLNSLKGL